LHGHAHVLPLFLSSTLSKYLTDINGHRRSTPVAANSEDQNAKVAYSRPPADIAPLVARNLANLGPAREVFLNMARSQRTCLTLKELQAAIAKMDIYLDESQVQALMNLGLKGDEKPSATMTFSQFVRFLDQRFRPLTSSQLSVPAVVPGAAPANTIPAGTSTSSIPALRRAQTARVLSAAGAVEARAAPVVKPNYTNEDELFEWYEKGIANVGSQILVRKFSIREHFLELDEKRTGTIPIEALADTLLSNGFPEPGLPETRERLIHVLEMLLKAIWETRSAEEASDSTNARFMSAAQRLAKKAQEFKREVTYNDMVDIINGRISPSKVLAARRKVSQQPLSSASGSIYKEETDVIPHNVLQSKAAQEALIATSVPADSKEKRVVQVLKHALRAARADKFAFDNLHRQMDKNKDGWISIAELCEGLEGLALGADFTKQPEFRNFVRKYCHVRQDYLTEPEFRAFMNLEDPESCTPEALRERAKHESGGLAKSKELLDNVEPAQLPPDVSADDLAELIVERIQSNFASAEEAFIHFDRNFDGFISDIEFYRAIKDLGIDPPASVAKQVYALLDPLNSGSFTIGSFVKFVSDAQKAAQQRRKVDGPAVWIDQKAAAEYKAGVSNNFTFGEIFNVPEPEFQLTDSHLAQVKACLATNPNVAFRTVFRSLDRGCKNYVSRDDVEFAWSEVNPREPYPSRAVDEIFKRLGAKDRSEGLGLAKFTRLLSSKRVSDLAQ